MNQPLITVILPVYNCEATIQTAINSILTQTYQNLEVIVVDDHSTDKTAEVVRGIQDKRIKFIENDTQDPIRFDKKLNRNVNAGYAARNMGLKYAHGEYITFQDADDASLANRIEVQFELLKKYNATHVTCDWFKYDEKYLHKKLNTKSFDKMVGPEETYKLAKRSKGFLMNFPHSWIPFYIKRLRFINKLFFSSLVPYPGVTGIPLFKKEVIEKVKFRPLDERVWPSFMGRGTDRDFSFRVAELYKNSYVFFIPLYMWRVKNDNLRYEKSIIEQSLE
jgi:glycosyltransferase involved in cell wall biosynthesis